MTLNSMITSVSKLFQNSSIDDYKFSSHTKYFCRCLCVLPSHTSSLDNSRVTLVFYGIAALDLLDSLATSLPYSPAETISWIYRLQMTDVSKPCGFRGSTCVITSRTNPNEYDQIHITMTMTSLLSLLLLGDDLKDVQRERIASSLSQLQLPSGAFLATPLSTENDLRFVYCACVIAFILNDWSGVDVERCRNFILQCRTYEFAFGQVPGAEAHGGSTFCAIASLSLMNFLDQLDHRDELIRWCLFRQDEGFHGRPHKPDDSCYSWWIVATLKLLDKEHLIDFERNKTFLHATESNQTGGFSKLPDASPDPLHSYLSLAGLALMKNPHLKSIHPALIVPTYQIDRLVQTLHSQWKT